jgi:putative oxidoreductase
VKFFEPEEIEAMMRKLISTCAIWSILPARLSLGIIFIAHGAQKVFGSFGGPGLAKWMTLSQLAPFPLRPAWLWLAADALGELLGGILIFFGLFTRVGAFLICCAMLTAIVAVHWPNFFITNRGFEYPMILIAVAVSLLIGGGGQASIDLYLTKRSNAK